MLRGFEIDRPDRVIELVDLLQEALRIQVISIVCQDKRGAWVIPRPGSEVAVIDALAKADWAAMRRIAEEWQQ